MNIKIKFLSIASILYFTLILSANSLFALPVDLNTFTPDPSWSIDIAPDGLSAILYEDWLYNPVILVNTDFYVQTDASSISFDYVLNVAPDNEDYFDFVIENEYILSVGGPGGTLGETFSGSFSYDVTDLRSQTVPVMIIFDLFANDLELQSDVTVSNVNINTVPLAIPEPGTCFLLGSLLLGMVGLGFKRYRRI